MLNAYGALPVPKLTPDLLALVKTGDVHRLSVSYQTGMMVPGPMLSYTISPHLRHGDIDTISPASAAAEVISMSIHVGTHIDALCHIGERQNAAGEPDATGEVQLFDGIGQFARAAEHADYLGQRHLEIGQMPPILMRGVVVDVAGHLGVAVLPDSYVVTAADVQGAAAAQNIEIKPNTAVLIRTGFHKHLREGNAAYRDAIAGLGLEAAQWLYAQGMRLAGADNMTVEAMPPNTHDVHRFLLVRHGVTHVENLFLDDLVASGAKEFLLIITPLQLTGATGSWVSPIAIT